MALDRRHGHDMADAVSGPGDIARKTEGERGGLLAVLLGDVVTMFSMTSGCKEVLVSSIRIELSNRRLKARGHAEHAAHLVVVRHQSLDALY